MVVLLYTQRCKMDRSGILIVFFKIYIQVDNKDALVRTTVLSKYETLLEIQAV